MPLQDAYRPKINGLYIGGADRSMENAGDYQYIPLNRETRNGEQVLIDVKRARVQWTFTSLLFEQIDWWFTDLLAGARSKAFTGATKLWEDRYNPDTMITFNYCVVDRPTVGRYYSARYRDVVVSIVGLTEP